MLFCLLLVKNMKKILFFLAFLNSNIANSHNLSLKDRALISHDHKVVSVKSVTANDSLAIWTNLQKTEYDKNIKSDYKIEIKYLEKKFLHKYGIIKGIKNNKRDWLLSDIIEKPDNNLAPSDMGVVGRYILKPSIFEILENTKEGAGGEIQLTDAIAAQIANEKVYAHEFEGKRFDCGNKLGFLKATIEYGLNHKDLSEDLIDYIKNLKIC